MRLETFFRRWKDGKGTQMKDFDNFLAGVGADGLQDIYEIKILICYLLDSVEFPLTRDQVNTIFQEDGMVNYFKFSQAEQELLASGHLTLVDTPEQKQTYALGPLGVETAHKLQTGLPRSLRDNVVRAAMNLQARLKKQREIETKLLKTQDGYLVECAIHDTGSDLLSFQLFAPDKLQAQQIKRRFSSRAAEVYKGLLGLLTGNRQAVEEVLRAMEASKES